MCSSLRENPQINLLHNITMIFAQDATTSHQFAHWQGTQTAAQQRAENTVVIHLTEFWNL